MLLLTTSLQWVLSFLLFGVVRSQPPSVPDFSFSPHPKASPGQCEVCRINTKNSKGEERGVKKGELNATFGISLFPLVCCCILSPDSTIIKINAHSGGDGDSDGDCMLAGPGGIWKRSLLSA